MKEEKPRRGAVRLSRLAVLAAAALLLYVCSVCRPFASVVRWQALDELSSGARAAFSALTQSLGQGESVAEAFADSYRVLTGAAED